jgi:hypothetical protein
LEVTIKISIPASSRSLSKRASSNGKDRRVKVCVALTDKLPFVMARLRHVGEGCGDRLSVAKIVYKPHRFRSPEVSLLRPGAPTNAKALAATRVARMLA